MNLKFLLLFILRFNIFGLKLVLFGKLKVLNYRFWLESVNIIELNGELLMIFLGNV